MTLTGYGLCRGLCIVPILCIKVNLTKRHSTISEKFKEIFGNFWSHRPKDPETFCSMIMKSTLENIVYWNGSSRSSDLGGVHLRIGEKPFNESTL